MTGIATFTTYGTPNDELIGPPVDTQRLKAALLRASGRDAYAVEQSHDVLERPCEDRAYVITGSRFSVLSLLDEEDYSLNAERTSSVLRICSGELDGQLHSSLPSKPPPKDDKGGGSTGGGSSDGKGKPQGEGGGGTGGGRGGGSGDSLTKAQRQAQRRAVLRRVAEKLTKACHTEEMGSVIVSTKKLRSALLLWCGCSPATAPWKNSVVQYIADEHALDEAFITRCQRVMVAHSVNLLRKADVLPRESLERLARSELEADEASYWDEIQRLCYFGARQLFDEQSFGVWQNYDLWGDNCGEYKCRYRERLVCAIAAVEGIDAHTDQ